jgi:hypothetical protein
VWCRPLIAATGGDHGDEQYCGEGADHVLPPGLTINCVDQ